MVSYKIEDNQLFFTFHGRLDTKNSLQLEDEIYAQLDKYSDKHWVFDLAGVDYASSAFLRICLTVAQKISHEQLTIRNLQPQVKKIFAIAELDKVFHIE